MKVFFYIMAVLSLLFAVFTFVTKTDVAWFTGGVLWLYMALGNLKDGLEISQYD